MSRLDIEAKVKTLAENTLRTIKLLRQCEFFNKGRDFVVYVGNDELTAIRFIGGEFHNWRDREHEAFCGYRLIGVNLSTYFHVAIK